MNDVILGVTPPHLRTLDLLSAKELERFLESFGGDGQPRKPFTSKSCA